MSFSDVFGRYHSHGVKCLDSARREHYRTKYMHPLVCFQRVIGLGWAQMVITKMFWGKLLAVKWSLGGSMSTPDSPSHCHVINPIIMTLAVVSFFSLCVLS